MRDDGGVKEGRRLDRVLLCKICPDERPLNGAEHPRLGKIVFHLLQVSFEDVADVIVPPGKLDPDLRHEVFSTRGGQAQYPLDYFGNAGLLIGKMRPGDHPRGIPDDFVSLSFDLERNSFFTIHVALSFMALDIFYTALRTAPRADVSTAEDVTRTDRGRPTPRRRRCRRT